MSTKEKVKQGLDQDLKSEVDANDSLLVRIEALLIQILRELKKPK